MQVLLIAATAYEIGPFIKQHPFADYLITGVGSPMAIYHISKRLQQVEYDLVVQAGIAGSFTESLPLASVVFVMQDNFADVGISAKNSFTTIFENGFAGQNEFPFTKGWLLNTGIPPELPALKRVSGITINTVTDNPEQIKMLALKYNAEVETMEGAALHYTCLMEKVPFIQLRSISNYVGERDKQQWKMDEAIDNLNNTLAEIFSSLHAGTMP